MSDREIKLSIDTADLEKMTTQTYTMAVRCNTIYKKIERIIDELPITLTNVCKKEIQTLTEEQQTIMDLYKKERNKIDALQAEKIELFTKRSFLKKQIKALEAERLEKRRKRKR